MNDGDVVQPEVTRFDEKDSGVNMNLFLHFTDDDVMSPLKVVSMLGMDMITRTIIATHTREHIETSLKKKYPAADPLSPTVAEVRAQTYAMDVNDLDSWLACLILLGINRPAASRDAFKTKWGYGDPTVRECMSREWKLRVLNARSSCVVA